MHCFTPVISAHKLPLCTLLVKALRFVHMPPDLHARVCAASPPVAHSCAPVRPFSCSAKHRTGDEFSTDPRPNISEVPSRLYAP